jgi:glycosyltransferase involved in cell wall biosynthesis
MLERKPAVLLISRVFSEYRKSIFDVLNEKYDFKILHSTNKSGISQVVTSYSIKVHSFKFSSKETGTYLYLSNYLSILKPQVVIHEFAIGIISMYTTYLRCRALGIKFILYSHGYNRKEGFHPEHSFLDKIRLYYLRRSDAVIVYGQLDRILLSRYINPAKIFVAQNTLDTNHLSIIKAKLEKEGRLELKQRLGFSQQFNLVFIGRLLEDKKPDLVVDVLKLLLEKFNIDVALHYIGDGPLLHELANKVECLGLKKRVYFHGAIYDDTYNGEILYASDMMVMPGYLGLSVNHSFCFECPIMSFDQHPSGPFHSPEVEYVLDNETGFLVKEHSAAAMAEVLNRYFKDLEIQHFIKCNINKMVRQVFPIEKMVKGFDDAIRYAID